MLDIKQSWTDWQPLTGAPSVSGDVLAETLDGGHAFRWNRRSDGIWLGQWANHFVQLRHGLGDRTEWRSPAATAPETASALPTYFGIDRDFASLTDSLTWRSDLHLAWCLADFRGLRLRVSPPAKRSSVFSAARRSSGAWGRGWN